MIKSDGNERQFLLATMSGTEQQKDTDVFNENFRVRDYVSIRRGSKWAKWWLEAPLWEVLSAKFLGLDESGRQKLEFQNPEYVASFRLGGDPRDYNYAFTLQVNGCTYECSFCFVPRELNDPRTGKGRFFAAADILDNFCEARRLHSERENAVNVIRLSGGEVTTLVPELIVDLNKEIDLRKMSQSVYLWIDSNLSTTKYLRNLEHDLEMAARQRNVGFVGCLKSIGNRETGGDLFSTLTKAKPEHFRRQFDVIDYLVNTIKSDLYLYILPIISEDKSIIRSRLKECVDELRRIHRNLPLRTNMLRIFEYTPAKANLIQAENEGRPLPKYDEGASFAAWYEILRDHYSESDVTRYRCQVPLD
jgi:uncharacterized Fe-S cluster-containing radical SAM superfamily protein